MRLFTVERLRVFGWAVLTVLAVVAVVVLLRKVFAHNHAPIPRAQPTIMQVVLPPPPPPPPPPPKEEPQKIEQAQPKEQTPRIAKPLAKATPSRAPAPPGNPLTAAPGAGPNQYGLAVGNGGGDTIGGGGGGGDPFAYYRGVVASRVRQLLQDNRDTRFGTYAIEASIWVSNAGLIERARLISSTGDAARDAAIARLLTGASIGEPMPDGLAQPIRLRIGATAPG